MLLLYSIGLTSTLGFRSEAKTKLKKKKKKKKKFLRIYYAIERNRNVKKDF